MKKRWILIVMALIIVALFGRMGQKTYAEKKFSEEIEAEIAKYTERIGSQWMREIKSIVGDEECKTISDADANLTKERQIGIQKVKEAIGAEFIREDSNYVITDLYNLVDGTLVAEVYIWTEIEYQYQGNNVTDVMAWGVTHYIEFTESEDGYIIEETSFDEMLVSGISCGNVEYYKSLEAEEKKTIEIEGLFVDGGQEEEINLIHEQTVRSTETNTRSIVGYAGYSPATAIAYADRWALETNDAYGTEVNDCANFVSQCLHEGGIAYINYDNYNTGWYHNGNGGSLNWIQVAAFDSFWREQGVVRKIATDTTLIPGNPLYYLNSSGATSGHLMFCVGYNPDGVPVVNAHNQNVYRQPYTSLTENVSSSLYTLCFVNLCSAHSLTYQWNISNHWRVCSSCGYQSTPSAHVFLNGYCRVCGCPAISAMMSE